MTMEIKKNDDERVMIDRAVNDFSKVILQCLIHCRQLAAISLRHLDHTERSGESAKYMNELITYLEEVMELLREEVHLTGLIDPSRISGG